MGNCLGRLLIIILLSLAIGFLLTVFPIILAFLPPLIVIVGLVKVVIGGNKILFASIAGIGLVFTILEIVAIRNPNFKNSLLVPLGVYSQCCIPIISLLIGIALLGWFFGGLFN